MTNIKNSVLAGIAFALFFGIYLTFSSGLKNALIAGPIAGIVFGLSMYLFISSKKVKTQTQIDVDDKEILYSGAANHFVNTEGVGGKLYLLNDKIVFKSHGFNIQNHEQRIDLNEVDGVIFYNTLGIIPNGLKIVLRNSVSEKFVVNNRQQWKDEISKIKNWV
jgi:hypothetical protein